MPGCPYFIASTFAHLFGGFIVTGISTENPLIPDLDKKPITGIFGVLVTLVLLVAVSFSDPGPFKYIVFGMFCVTLGQILSGLVKHLQQDQILSRTLILVGTIFATMTIVGFADKGNMLSWEKYLYAGLIGLVLATVGIAIFTKPDKETSSLKRVISWLIVILFTMFIGYDVQVLKENAKSCKSNPDYIQESMNLYLDFMNIFQGIGAIKATEA